MTVRTRRGGIMTGFISGRKSAPPADCGERGASVFEDGRAPLGSLRPGSLRKPAGIAGFFIAASAGLFFAGAMSAPARAQMMLLPGQFDVSPTGAALYSVPIEVPPGTGGMSPALTLDYDSDGGAGLLGVGWNLGGLPSIGRCPRTPPIDGVRGRVDFTANDRFCMDGQRLIVIAGTYGAANSEYRTEIDGFTKVVANGTAGTGPASFTAWTKSGQIIEFGNTSDSRILATGTATARAWAANKITDTKGNYLTITYQNDATNGQAYPTRIDYTGNAAASLSPYNSVQFEYEARPDIVPLHIAGSLVRNTVRLKKVKTYAGATPVKAYRLNYATGSSTARSRITAIELCNGAETACLPATNFALTDASLTFPTLSTNPVATAEMGSSVALYVGDWNGDGVTDAMTWNPSTGTNKWFVNNGSLSFTTTTNPIAAAEITGTSTSLRLGDWDGDGITDVMWFKASDGTNKWFTNTSTGGAPGFTQQTNIIPIANLTGGGLHILDYNGDALTDAVFVNPYGGNTWYTNNGTATLSFAANASSLGFEELGPVEDPPDTLRFRTEIIADWNGDGQADVLTYYNPYSTSNRVYQWHLNNGSLGFTPAGTLTTTNTTQHHFGDWNGDGTADLLLYVASSGANSWYLNNGAAAFSLIAANPITTSTIANTGYILNVGDWNADGVSDVMFHLPSSGTNRWFTTSWSSAGALQFAYSADPVAASSLSGASGAIAFGDWNGDGFEDPMFRLASDGTNRWWRKTVAGPPDRLASVTTGLGSSTIVTMKPITDNSVYTKDATAVYPDIDIEAPFYVTSRVDAANGVGGHYASSYSYAGAKVRIDGRGFLGFRQQTTTDLQTNVMQTLTFHQDFPFTGFVLTDRKSLSGNTLNLRANAYEMTTTGTAPNRYYWPYIQTMTEQSNDLNNAAFPTVTSSYTYDAFGNPLTVTVSTPADGATRVTTNTYSNTTSPNWILGRLLSSTVSSTTPDTPPAPTGCQSNCNATTPSFSVNDVSANEGSALVFTVTRAGPSSGSYSVTYATANGTATAGSDYTAITSTTLTFASGETSKTVSVATLSDAVSEGAETVLLNLSGATGGATISDAQGVGTITNIDPAPSFSVNDVSANEGSALVFTVTRAGTSTGSYSVNYATANGTATAGADYTATSGTLTFASGETSKTVSVATLSDAVSEGTETVLLNLSGATGGATISDTQGAGTITNVNPPPTTFSVSDAYGNEGETIVFTVTRSGDSSGTNSVSYATANGTAVAPGDYGALSGTLTFTSGQTTKTLSTSLPYGSNSEPETEVMYLNLSSPTGGATISDSQGIGSITNILLCGGVPC